MNGDITLEALRRCQRASKVISPFIIFDVFDVSYRRYKLQINTTVFYIYSVLNAVHERRYEGSTEAPKVSKQPQQSLYRGWSAHQSPVILYLSHRSKIKIHIRLQLKDSETDDHIPPRSSGLNMRHQSDDIVRALFGVCVS